MARHSERAHGSDGSGAEGLCEHLRRPVIGPLPARLVSGRRAGLGAPGTAGGPAGARTGRRFGSRRPREADVGGAWGAGQTLHSHCMNARQAQLARRYPVAAHPLTDARAAGDRTGAQSGFDALVCWSDKEGSHTGVAPVRAGLNRGPQRPCGSTHVAPSPLRPKVGTSRRPPTWRWPSRRRSGAWAPSMACGGPSTEASTATAWLSGTEGGSTWSPAG